MVKKFFSFFKYLLLKYKVLFLILIFIIFLILFLSIFIFSFYKVWEKDKTYIYYEIKSLSSNIRTFDKKYFKVFEINIYDKNDKLIANIKKNQYIYVEFNKYPVFLIDLLLLKEDRDFFNHKGFNIKRIIGSLFNNLKNRAILYGGSTITQQVSKLLFTDRKKTIKRKIYELFTSYFIENVLTKEEILEIYLNIIYLGFGRYGFESASIFYFNKHVYELNFAEALMLVSIISAPKRYSPLKNIEVAKEKYNDLLRKCLKAGLISKEKFEEKYKDFWEKYNFNKNFREINFINNEISPWITDLVLSEIDKNYGLENAFLNNFNVYTTFDLNAIYALNNALNIFLNNNQLFGERLKKEDLNNIEIALISVDAENSQIIAICGGKKYSSLNQFNRAFYSLRQTGSLFKPLLFLFGFYKKLITPITIYEDKEYTFNIGENIIWEPKNFNNKYYGKVPIYFAIKKSLNSVAAKLAMEIDLNEFIEFLRNIFGDIRGDFDNRFKPYPSIVLGSIEMSLIEVSTAYLIVANGGYKINPYFIKKIESFGKIIFNSEKNREERKIRFDKFKLFDSKYSDLILYLLKFPLEKGGTAYNARLNTNFFYQTFGKTGTTNNGRDSWFAGITGKLVTVVWVGYDKGGGSQFLTGGSYAANLYFEYIKNIYQFYLKYYDFKDSDLVFKSINLNNIGIFLEDENNVVTLPFDRENYPYDILEKSNYFDNNDNINENNNLNNINNKDSNMNKNEDTDQDNKNLNIGNN